MHIKNLPEKYQPIWQQSLPLLKHGRPGDDQHAIEVAEFILNYQGDKKIDYDILIPTAIMHDIGHSAILPEHFVYVTGERKLINGKLAHMLAGAKIARDILNTIGYNKERSAEIVDIISVHDADQLKGVDLVDWYNSENKKIFHNIDVLDRYTNERLDSMRKLFPSKTRSEVIELIRQGLSSFFFDEFKSIAQRRLELL